MKEYKLKINGNEYIVNVAGVEDSIAEVEVNGIPFKVEIDSPLKKQTVTTPKVNKPASVQPTVAKPTATVVAAAPSLGEVAVSSPLPGVILDVVVKEGDAVKKGQKLMVLEAMKMENNILAEKSGTIVKVCVAPGASVMQDEALFEIN